MDKIRIGLFDFFAYVIPGFIVCLCVFISFYDLNNSFVATLKIIFRYIRAQTIYSASIVIFMSYIIGFVLHFFGYNYFNMVAKQLWRKALNGKSDKPSALEHKYVQIRHFSSENFKYILQYNAYRGMAFNLSLSLAILSVELIYKITSRSFFSVEWLFALVLCTLSSVITLNRAVKFHIWSWDTTHETMKILPEIKADLKVEPTNNN